MTAKDIVKELKALGSESIKKVLLKHGIQEPLYRVKVEELKKIQKRIKKDYQLALDLYDTGIYDAMYLAGLIAVGTYMRPLTDVALKTAQKISQVSVDVGDTACKVPYAPEYIEKARKKGVVGKNRKTAKC